MQIVGLARHDSRTGPRRNDPGEPSQRNARIVGANKRRDSVRIVVLPGSKRSWGWPGRAPVRRHARQAWPADGRRGGYRTAQPSRPPKGVIAQRCNRKSTPAWSLSKPTPQLDGEVPSRVASPGRGATSPRAGRNVDHQRTIHVVRNRGERTCWGASATLRIARGFDGRRVSIVERGTIRPRSSSPRPGLAGSMAPTRTAPMFASTWRSPSWHCGDRGQRPVGLRTARRRVLLRRARRRSRGRECDGRRNQEGGEAHHRWGARSRGHDGLDFRQDLGRELRRRRPAPSCSRRPARAGSRR